MGIIVQGKKVVFDAATNDLVNCSVADNPVVQRVGNGRVYSVFRRVGERRDGSSHKGDGNPLMYAMKKINGYSIDRANLVAFLPEFYGVLGKLIPHIKADFVLPMPSSSVVAEYFAKRVAREFCVPMYKGWLAKKTFQEVVVDLDTLLGSGVGFKRDDRRELDQLRKDLVQSPPSASFSMKKVPMHLRKHFSPFKLLAPHLVPANASALLVDDLLATGTSLRSAASILKAHGVGSVSRLCLLSSRDNFKKV